MSAAPLSLIKSEYFGGPLDGDKRRADEYQEYYASSVVGFAHRYHRTDRGMEYSGLWERSGEVRPLHVGLER